MVGWHYQHNEHEFAQTEGDMEGRGSLACCSPWGRKEPDTTERLNNKSNKDMKPNFPIIFPICSKNQCFLLLH